MQIVKEISGITAIRLFEQINGNEVTFDFTGIESVFVIFKQYGIYY